MSGPALRAPYPVPNYAPGPTPRAMMRSQNANPLLMSVSKPNFGRTPVQRQVLENINIATLLSLFGLLGIHLTFLPVARAEDLCGVGVPKPMLRQEAK